jgi:hypothetical protein
MITSPLSPALRAEPQAPTSVEGRQQLAVEAEWPHS